MKKKILPICAVMTLIIIVSIIIIVQNNKNTGDNLIADAENISTEAVPESRHETENETEASDEAGESKETGKTESQNQETVNEGVKETLKPTQAANPTTPATKPPVKETQQQTQREETTKYDPPKEQEIVTQAPTEPQENHIVYNEDGEINLKESYWYHDFLSENYNQQCEEENKITKMIRASTQFKNFINDNNLIDYNQSSYRIGTQILNGPIKRSAKDYLYYFEQGDRYIEIGFDGENFYLK